MSGILYTIGWFLLVWGGASGKTFWPLCFAVFAMVWLLWRTPEKTRSMDFLTLLYASFFGYVLESINVKSGLVSYQGFFWILALYPLFALTLNHTLSFLKRSMVLASILGGVGGLLSYRAGEALHAVQVNGLGGWIFLGMAWALFVPGMFILIRQLERLSDQVYADQSPVRMLYDGGCPICSREVSFLKKRNDHGLVEFIDMDQRDAYEGISKEEAMKQMLVLDAQGEIHRGVDAFFALYGRVGLQGLALFLKAPLFYPLNKIAYRIFAYLRKRL